MVVDARDAIGNHNAGQAPAIAERSPADARDAIGNRDAHKTAAIVERSVADALNDTPVMDRRYFDVGVGAGSDSGNSAGSVSVE